MEIQTKQLKRVDVVEIHGRVDSNTAAALEDVLKSITEAKRYRIVIDMQNMEYISSRGLRALITSLKECRRWNRGDVRLSSMSPRIKEVFDMTGLTPQFRMFEDPVEAVGSF